MLLHHVVIILLRVVHVNYVLRTQHPAITNHRYYRQPPEGRTQELMQGNVSTFLSPVRFPFIHLPFPPLPLSFPFPPLLSP